jgi:hypothetical protein
VVGDLVLWAPEEPVGGNAREERPAGTQHSRDLPQHPYIVVHVLEHVQGGDQVEAAGIEGKGEGIDVAYILDSPLAAEVDGLLVGVDPLDLAVSGEVLDHRPRSAAHVENPPSPPGPGAHLAV